MSGPAASASSRSTTSRRSTCPAGSWSRVILTGDRVGLRRPRSGSPRSRPGPRPRCCRTRPRSSPTCCRVTGELRLEDEVVPYGPGSALYIPAGVWHAVVEHRQRAGDAWCSRSRIPTIRRPSGDESPTARRHERRAPARGRDRVPGHRPRGLCRPDARPCQRPRARVADSSGSSARASRSTRSSPTMSSRSTSTTPTRSTSADYHLESVMHTEVYRARPDVNAVIHGHPTYATALGSVDAPLRMLTHDAVLFVDGIGAFDEGPELRDRPAPSGASRRGAGPAASRAAAQPRRRHRRRGRALGGAHGARARACDPLPGDRRTRSARLAQIPERRGPRAPAAEVPGRVPRRLLGRMGAARDERTARSATSRSHRRTVGAMSVRIEPLLNGRPTAARGRAPRAAARRAPRPPRADRREALLRRPGLRDVHGPRRRRCR